MRTFPANFNAMKNIVTGSGGLDPVWILYLSAGGNDYFISDQVRYPVINSVGINTLPWVKSWGQLQEGISGTLDEFRISDLNIDILIYRDYAVNMGILATSYALEQSPCSLYLWFQGCSDSPQEMWRGYIREVTIPDETLVTLTLQDESLRLERTMVGTKINLTDYPGADLDDVGKVGSIPFGVVTQLPALAIDAGLMTSLPAAISASATSIIVSDNGFLASMVLWIDQEKVLVGSVSGTTLTVTRGNGGTTAVAHDKGAVVWENQTEFVYLAAGVPVTAIPKVWGQVGQARIDITSICTRYTGQTGSQHPTYPNRAIVTIPGYVTAAQSVALLPDASGLTISMDGATVASLLALSDPGHYHNAAVSSSDATTSSLPSGLAYSIYVGPGYYWGIYGNPTIWGLALSFPAAGPRTSASYSMTMVPNQNAINVSFFVVCNGAIIAQWPTMTWVSGSPFTFTFNTGSVNSDTIWLCSNSSGNFHMVGPATRTVQVSNNASSSSSTGSSLTSTATIGYASKTGSITLSGNSVANTLVADAVMCDLTATQTSISGVFNQILTLAGYPGTFTTTGTWPASYTFSGAITEYQSALYWLNYLAFQARAWFKLSAGIAQLIYRDTLPASVKTLDTCRISGGKKVWSRKKTTYDEILNTINLLYARDWTMAKGPAAYKALLTSTDTTSIATYGERERPELFQLDFVSDLTMAGDLAAFYKYWYSNRHWLHEFETFLYDVELEFGDTIVLGFAAGEIGQVLQCQPAPGSSEKSDVIGLVVVV